MEMNLDGGVWEIEGPFDADVGTYAKLYLVRSSDGVEAVAKCVPKKPGAHRELLFADSLASAQHTNVMPVIDSGEHADHFVMVMPRADRSLKQYIDQNSGALPHAGVIKILIDIAAALAGIGGDIVHRDLKPANILLHEGVWKLADFGISRYAEAATATETRRASFTFEYAAPEQWLHERTSGKTDVYAFGVIAYELLEGRRPFDGPDYREQHLTQAPLKMTTGSPRIQQMIFECLMKDPRSRPAPESLTSYLLASEIDAAKHGTTKLAAVSARRVQQLSAEQAREAAERAAEERLFRIVGDAQGLLRPVVNELRSELLRGAPECEFDTIMGNAAPIFRARVDRSVMEFDRVDPVAITDLPFAVYAYSSISVQTQNNTDPWVGRSHSLWYCEAESAGAPGWYELAFSAPRSQQRRPRVEPYATAPWNAGGLVDGDASDPVLCWPLSPLNLADPSEFIQRWLGWFADAISGEIERPL